MYRCLFWQSALVATFLFTPMAGSACGQSQSNGSNKHGRPNVVFFFVVDDWGWNDTSVQFHNERTIWNALYDTPHMQRLADSGM